VEVGFGHSSFLGIDLLNFQVSSYFVVKHFRDINKSVVNGHAAYGQIGELRHTYGPLRYRANYRRQLAITNKCVPNDVIYKLYKSLANELELLKTLMTEGISPEEELYQDEVKTQQH